MDGWLADLFYSQVNYNVAAVKFPGVALIQR